MKPTTSQEAACFSWRSGHTFATCYLAANPNDLRGLARLLGHSNLNTVMIYTEPDMDTLTMRMERVETLIE